MTRPATSFAARPRGAELLRFALGIVASALLVVGMMFLLLAVTPALVPGWRTTAVGSGSMVPAFEVGDAVVVEAWPQERGMLGPPSVVLIERPGLTPLLHRVVGDDGRTYRTKGDANPNADGERVSPGRVIGVGRLVVPKAGWLSLWIEQRNVLALGGVTLGVLVLARLARYGWLDEYDPWGAGRRDAGEPETAVGPAPSPPAVVTADDGAARVPATTRGVPRGSRSWSARIRMRHALLVAIVMTCILAGIGRSTSALTAQTSSNGALRAATLSAPQALTARCSSQPATTDANIGTLTTETSDDTAGAAATAGDPGPSPSAPSSSHVTLTWTPSATAQTTGYTVWRDGAEVADVAGRETAIWRDPAPLGSAATTFSIAATIGGWTSPRTSVTTSADTC